MELVAASPVFLELFCFEPLSPSRRLIKRASRSTSRLSLVILCAYCHMAEHGQLCFEVGAMGPIKGAKEKVRLKVQTYFETE